MQRFIFTIFGMWLFMFGAIVAAMQIPVGHPCLKPILSSRSSWNLYENIRDFRTSLEVDLSYISISNSISLDGQYEYIIPPTDIHELYLRNPSGGNLRLLFEGENRITAYWSADSQSLFIHERHYTNNTFSSQRLFRLDIESGNVLNEYAYGAYIINDSIIQPFLGIGIPTDDTTYQLAVIDTITGQQTIYDYYFIPHYLELLTSLDEQLLAVVDEGMVSIFDTQTGEYSQHLSRPFSGMNVAWTTDSVWFTQIDGMSSSIKQVSINDGSLMYEQDAGFEFYVSADNHWLLYENPVENTIHLYDTENQITYPIADNYDWIVHIWKADFSHDERCLVIVSRESAYQATYEVTIYDLSDISIIFHLESNAVSENRPQSTYYFYESE